MTQAPAKEERKEDKDNFFVELLYNIFLSLPVLVIGWIWEKITD